MKMETCRALNEGLKRLAQGKRPDGSPLNLSAITFEAHQQSQEYAARLDDLRIRPHISDNKCF